MAGLKNPIGDPHLRHVPIDADCAVKRDGHPGMPTSSIFNTKQVATLCNRAAEGEWMDASAKGQHDWVGA